jgi:hypothetical protein
MIYADASPGSKIMNMMAVFGHQSAPKSRHPLKQDIEESTKNDFAYGNQAILTA